jgi:hypothetical protein
MNSLKVSVKMRRSIAKLEKKYGILEKRYGSNTHPYHAKYYCWCELRCDILKSLHYTILHNGDIHS